MASIIRLLKNKVADHPAQLLYRFLDIEGKVIEEYSYATFYERVSTIAAHLYIEYSFSKGERILLTYPPGIEMLCAFFACTKIGLIPVPVYPPTKYGFESAVYKMTFIAKDCGATAILTCEEYHESFKLNRSNSHSYNGFSEKHYLSTIPWINTRSFNKYHKSDVPEEKDNELLFLQYTSGSTSRPKGVMVSHENVINNCNATLDFTPIGASWLPQYHDMGLIGFALFTILKGGTTYGFSPIDFIQNPSLWLETISKYRCNCSSAPNFAYEYCLRPGKITDEVFEKLDLSTLKILMTAAEPVNSKIYQQFLNTFQLYGLSPNSFSAAYGLAEFTLAVSNYGQRAITLDKDSLNLNQVKITSDISVPTNLSQTIMSCGRPLGDTEVKIVDEKTHLALVEGHIGEIWLKGKSKCSGYWNKPILTEQTFQARLLDDKYENDTYLRTGDLGFLDNGELFVCGRSKDMIIIRGLNYYPQDIEWIVEMASDKIRRGSVAAFSTTLKGEQQLIVAIEVKNPKSIPDPLAIMSEVRKIVSIEISKIIFLFPGTIPKTSSGKIARQETKQACLSNKLNPLHQFDAISSPQKEEECPLTALKEQYNLTGKELYSLGEVGIDSIDLAHLLNDIEVLLKQKGVEELAQQISIRLLQEVQISDLFEFVEQFKTSSIQTTSNLYKKLLSLQKEYFLAEQQRILEDTRLSFELIPSHSSMHISSSSCNILLTGGTGFLGPFILKNLLQQTPHLIYVLVRAQNIEHGKERLWKAFKAIGDISSSLESDFRCRVIPVCGDLAKPRLGLETNAWTFLATHISSIFHNGAMVNYLFNYEKMRGVNVEGTNEILKLAFEKVPKTFNHISTTFVFGWATKNILLETDTDYDINLLDFGYSQTKWVSEQLVRGAMKKGLNARIFRPALISPSVNGAGHNFDISIRLFAFMINHKISVNALNQLSLLPADISATNIVAIANLEDTLNNTFHVTRDHHANMKDVAVIIEELTGVSFQYYTVAEFVPRMVALCSKEDLLFPLLNFFTRSADKISAMEFKRYDSSTYQVARNSSYFGKQDPTLKDTVRGMLLFMQKHGIINVALLDPHPMK